MIFYVDGACSGNPGPGGYGVVGYDDSETTILIKHQEFSYQTTNNREELKAILYVLKNYGNTSDNEIPTVYSDSAYSVNTITNWMYGWANKGWVKSDNKIPENLDLIKTIYNLIQSGNKINLLKIKGHRGIAGNELADDLATGRIII